jgi:hypothetical protein
MLSRISVLKIKSINIMLLKKVNEEVFKYFLEHIPSYIKYLETVFTEQLS